MAQIVQGPPSLGERIGTGISSGLQQLLNSKLQEIQNQKGASQLQSIFGFSPKESQFFSSRPELLSEYLKRGGGMAGAQPQQESVMAPLQELMSPEQSGIQALQQQLGIKPSQAMPEQAMQQQAQPEAEAFQQQAGKKPSLREVFAQPTAAEKRDLKKIEIAERKAKAQEEQFKQKEEREAKKTAFKETKAERKQIIDKAKAAKQNLHDLNRMEELEKEGKLDTPGYVEFLKRSGLDIPALLNPGSEEFNKIAANFIRGAKDTFGSRISNFEVEQFLRTLPNLSQSTSGRSRVIANLKYLNRADIEYNEALKDIMAKNKNIPPLDLLEQVDLKVDKKLSKLADKFKEDLAKPVPKGQNKLITALQAAAGSLVGAPGSLISGLGGSAIKGLAGLL